MRRSAVLILLSATLAFGCASAATQAQDGGISQGTDNTGEPIGTWRLARASWYGTPDWVKPFAATRGGGLAAFGILEWGGCGYTNGDGSLAFDKNNAAAYSDDNPDWAGSCGRCYEVRCKEGPVIGAKDPIPMEYLYNYPEYYVLPDEQGRMFPGNPGGEAYMSAKCWSNSSSIVVKIVDLCPCYYCPEGQECRYQESCCYKRINHPKAGQMNLDLSFWAFQQLAHPEYGIMMVDFRPVDCNTKQPLPFIPGFISKTLYDDTVGSGWAWFAANPPADAKNNFNVTAAGQGVDGSTAACAEVQGDEKGAITFWARGAGTDGFTPFAGVNTVSFAIKDTGNPGSAPNVQVSISGDASLPTNAPHGSLPDEPPVEFCDNKVYLPDRTPSATLSNGFLQYDIPFSDFGCKDANKLNKMDFFSGQRATLCVDNVKLE